MLLHTPCSSTPQHRKSGGQAETHMRHEHTNKQRKQEEHMHAARCGAVCVRCSCC
jgi:hypothetical protein